MTKFSLSHFRTWLGERHHYARLKTLVLFILAFCIAIGLTLWLPKAMSVGIGFLLFLPLVLAIALASGFWPAIGATAFSLVICVLIRPERGFSSFGEGAAFLVLAVTASIGGAWDARMRRQRDAAARVSEERQAHLRSIFDTALEAMIVINEFGVIQEYGVAAERVFQWRPDEVIGRNVKVLMPPNFRDGHDGYLSRYMSTGEKRIIGSGRIVVGQRKDGATFPMHLAVSEVQSAHGRFFTGFVRDMTQQEEREARMQQLQSELIHISRSNAMGEMAAALAHELNQPLSAVVNYLAGAQRVLARTPSDNARAIDAIQRATDQTLRAGDIIRKLRNFLARGESDRSIESLGQIVHEACGLALVGAKELNVQVVYELDAHLDRVVVDKVQIQQVIVNLVRNALDAMQNQTRRVLTISTRVGPELAMVQVADTGTGIDEAVATQLFQPFVTSKDTGMGVGLSISRSIIESHGGRIWAEPNPGGGTVFSFNVRLAVEEEVA